MNQVIDQMMNRRSIRAFTGAAVKDQDLDLILRAAQQAPTSLNGQQISLIVTRDKETIQKIAAIAGGQPQVATADVFITVVIDFNRTAKALQRQGVEQVIEGSAEGIVAGSIDAGIMINAVQTAANSLGYGTTAIGGVRANPAAMIELLGLPEKTYPVNGITLGVVDEQRLPQVKPRVPLNSFAMKDRYDVEAVEQGIEAYDETLANWWRDQGLAEMGNYGSALAGFYSKVYFPTIAQTLEAQGFKFRDAV